MATYFHGGSEIQANSEGIHTLYLMNPNYVPYSDTHSQTPSNMLFLNPSSHALTPSTLPHAPPSSNHFVGIPLPTTDAPRPSYHHEISALHSVPAQRLHYNLWAPMDPSHQGISGTGETGDLGFRRPFTQQGLSLTLSSQQSLYRTVSAEQEIQGGGGAAAGISARSGDEIRVSGNSATSVSVVSSSGITGVESKYLKAAQELLDEVVNVGKGNFYKSDKEVETKDKMKMKMKKESSTAAIAETNSKLPPPPDLTTAQRQDLQMKKAKLIGMLDEVEQKYRQYHEQMQGVVSSFEQAAGLGSAKSYAWLALQTISKQFRCLKDAICAQIKATGKSLGEDQDWLGGKIEGSRLRYVDHHLRQQRALQQLGMIQHNTWRPQRGLPERAVSVLRAWLFEHFLHPYPKDSDKIILAKQTGLTRSQVSNWFINARVRLWKPMVEEMYLEEIKDQEQNGDSHDMNRNNKNEPNKQHGGDQNNNASSEAFKLNHHMKDPQSKTENLMNNQNNNNNVSNSSILGSLQTHSGFNLVRPSSDILSSPKKPRTTNNQLETTPSTKTSMLCRDINDTKHLIQTTAEMNMNMNTTTTATNNHHNNHGGGFGSYPIGEIGSRFNSELLTPRFHANGVSLTLGLPHSDHNLSLSGTQQNYLSNRNLQLANGQPPDHFSDINPAPPPPHSTSTAYDAVDIQTTKRFAAQLLPDFVA